MSFRSSVVSLGIKQLNKISYGSSNLYAVPDLDGSRKHEQENEQVQQNKTKVMKKIRLVGRLAASALIAIFLEGLMTLGHAYNFSEYGPMGWIVQGLILVLVVWIGAEWHDHEERLNS